MERPHKAEDRTLVARALAGEGAAVQAVVSRLTPVIQARVARRLLRAGRPAARVRQEVLDLVQEVFVVLFERQGRVLASWDADRGLSLENFVGLVAERHTLSTLRRGRGAAWTEDTPIDELEAESPEAGPEVLAASHEAVDRLLGRLQESVSPLGWRVFSLLYIQERTVADVEGETGLSAAAVYAWRTRLRRLARTLLAEPESETGARTRIPEVSER
jgi:RNA polymerase sigma-70 factor (ECF subfamily)